MRSSERYDHHFCLACQAATKHGTQEEPHIAGELSYRSVGCNEICCRDFYVRPSVSWISRARDKEARRARLRCRRKNPKAFGNFQRGSEDSTPTSSWQPRGRRRCATSAFRLAKQAAAELGEELAHESSLAEYLEKEV